MPCDWVQGYGLSETFGPFCWMTEDDHRAGAYRHHVHCVGRPDETVEIRIDATAAGEIGEVLLRGNSLMRGYVDQATGQPADVEDWFRTGDMGLFTPEGILVLKGKASGTLLSANGHRIFPEEVEAALAEVAGVTEALLLALPADVDLGSPPVGCIHGPLAFEEADVIKSKVAEALVGTLAQEKWPRILLRQPRTLPAQRQRQDQQARGLAVPWRQSIDRCCRVLVTAMPTTSHAILCSASRDTVYRIIDNFDRWPELFEPCLEARALERNTQCEDIEITAMINGAPVRWRSRRHFLPDVLGIDAVSLVPMPLVQSMRTRWRVIAANDAQCALLLEHDFEVLEDVAGLFEGVATPADAAAFIACAIETNSTCELVNIREAVALPRHLARHQGPTRRVCSIICDVPAAAVYDAIADTCKWPLLFDSCVSVAVLENGPHGELTRIEALQGDRIIGWTTRRHYHPEVLSHRLRARDANAVPGGHGRAAARHATRPGPCVAQRLPQFQASRWIKISRNPI